MEVLAAHAAMAGAPRETVQRVMRCITTTEALELLKEAHLLGTVMQTVTERVEFYLSHRAGERLQIGAILFSTEEGVLGATSKAEELLGRIQHQKPEY